jgi:predicted HTH transcriptional regulator
LEVERRKLKTWAAGLTREVERRRDEGLRRLDLSESALVAEATIVVTAPQGRSRRTGERGATVAVLAERRREAIIRFLVEQRDAVTFSTIHKTLRLSEFSTRSALKRLIKEGSVVRTGTGAGTRYAARDEGAGSTAVPLRGQPDPGGTLQGRLLELVEDRGSATSEELAQALRVPREEIQAECGRLIREEEIRMASRDGRPVYTVGLAAA